MPLQTTPSGKLLVTNDVLAVGAGCCCGQPTTCACVDWCCVEPAISIKGNTLPYKTFQEWVDDGAPAICDCTFSAFFCQGAGQEMYFSYNDPESPVGETAGILNFSCGGDPEASSVSLRFFRYALGPDGTPGFATFGWIGSAPINFDCNGGPLSVGEWTTNACKRDNVALDPALEPEYCAPPATVVFGGTFPCNPLP
jgi:hypothetical protein